MVSSQDYLLPTIHEQGIPDTYKPAWDKPIIASLNTTLGQKVDFSVL